LEHWSVNKLFSKGWRVISGVSAYQRRRQMKAKLKISLKSILSMVCFTILFGGVVVYADIPKGEYLEGKDTKSALVLAQGLGQNPNENVVCSFLNRIDFQKLKNVLQLLYHISILFGIPVGLFQYYRTVKKEQQDREYGTYNALDEKYLEFQELCLKQPHLDVFDIPDSAPSPLTEEQKKQELIAFTILFSIFERAYLMYRDQSKTIREEQWSGWRDYIAGYCKRKNFKKAWDISGRTFDASFQKYMDERLKEAQLTPESHAHNS
jgi:hypothetical protein